MRTILLLATFAASMWAQDASDAAWQLTLRLSQVKRQVRAALSSQPDFTCLATFNRYRWLVNEGAEKKVDTVRVEVAYVGGKELYSWPGEGKFSDAPLTQMIGMGLVGDGEFATHAHNLFVADGARETFAGEEQLNGRKVWRWDYSISAFSNGWSLQHSGMRQNAGSQGSFWIDAQTLDLLKMDSHATDLLPSFPLKAVVSTVEYGKVRIGEREELLPLRAQLETVTKDGSGSRNETEYSGCRQYTGQSTISFGVPAEAPPPAPVKTASVEGTLPAGLLLKIRLTNPLVLAQASVGSPLEATLTSALIRNGKELAPKGAVVRGRVRLLTADVKDYVELGVVFDELEFPGHLQRFTASLKAFDTVLPGVQMNMITNKKYAPVGNDISVTRTEIRATNVPGASVFFVDARSAGLPAGTVMTWLTK